MAQRDAHYKLTALFEIVGFDDTIMELYQRTGQVETDACAEVAIVGAGRRLVESLEDAV